MAHCVRRRHVFRFTKQTCRLTGYEQKENRPPDHGERGDREVAVFYFQPLSGKNNQPTSHRQPGWWWCWWLPPCHSPFTEFNHISGGSLFKLSCFTFIFPTTAATSWNQFLFPLTRAGNPSHFIGIIAEESRQSLWQSVEIRKRDQK